MNKLINYKARNPNINPINDTIMEGIYMINKQLKVICLIGFLLLCCNIDHAEKRQIINTVNQKIYHRCLLDLDTIIITHHKTTINNKNIKYTAIAGTLPVYDENDSPIAKLFYTYYKRTNCKQSGTRPIVFCFNGGPGVASAWLHIGYLGPRIVNLSKSGFPIQPYGYSANSHSLLDIADLVFIDPVGTGYSKIMAHSNKDQSRFFSQLGDNQYLSEWITTFLSKYNRWLSPKYLLGESYGTTRISGMSRTLQQMGVYLNGVILVSSSGWGTDPNSAVNDALRFPFYTKIAWSNGLLNPQLQKQPIDSLMKVVTDFADFELTPALIKGGSLDLKEREKIACLMSLYSSLSTQLILDNNLDIDTATFFKAMLPQKLKAIIPYDKNQIENYTGGVDAMSLVSCAAAAWYYHLLSPMLQNLQIDTFLQKVIDFTIYQFIPALITNRELDKRAKAVIASKIAQYTGLSAQDVTNHDLLYFFKDFGRGDLDYISAKTGFSIGGDDVRYRGINGITYQADASFDQSFVPVINDYMTNELNYRSNRKYVMNGHRSWDRAGNYNANKQLAEAMALNPFMQVLFQSGYYDFTCPYLFQKYVQWQLDLNGSLQHRIHAKAYAAGHMMYVARSERIRALGDIREFIENSIPKKGDSAKY